MAEGKRERDWLSRTKPEESVRSGVSQLDRQRLAVSCCSATMSFPGVTRLSGLLGT